ncbi:MAG: PfkB family carbohydrate kinase, partial [bacterium]
NEALEILSPSALLVTRGEEGMTLYRSPGDSIHLDTRARDVYDVTGAGDTVSGIMTLGEALGLDRENVIKIANTAAGMVVGKMGTVAVEPDELKEALEE